MKNHEKTEETTMDLETAKLAWETARNRWMELRFTPDHDEAELAAAEVTVRETEQVKIAAQKAQDAAELAHYRATVDPTFTPAAHYNNVERPYVFEVAANEKRGEHTCPVCGRQTHELMNGNGQTMCPDCYDQQDS